MIPRRLKPMMRIESVVLLVTAWVVATLNGSWWTAAGQGRDWWSPSTWIFLIATYVALVALHFAVMAPLMSRWTVRPLLSVIVVASAAAAYYMREYAVMLDPAMIQNILRTDVHEARELLSWSMVGSVFIGAVVPVGFIWTVRIERHSWLNATLVRMGWVVGAMLVAVLAVLPVNRDLTSMMRNHRELRYLVTPGNFIWGLASRSLSNVRDAAGPRLAVGTDAHVVRVSSAARPRVFVLVLGETARAANFSLLGYARVTNPELAKLDVTAFRDVRSCGTSTEVSVPCMFSPYGRADYDEGLIRRSEGLLDVLVRAGYAVKWLDNQSGCKGVCQGSGVELRKTCPGGECLDGVLVTALAEELVSVRHDTVIVLHMMGNHGPAYFNRYPPQFRRFVPECATAELRDCTRDEVVNSYDNAILYTDHVLAAIVGQLQARSAGMDAAMLYLSDHGESLGEAGLYLHGLPNSIAPDTQTRVPMIAWASPQFAQAVALDRGCLRREAGKPFSHDNLFHSVLGVLDVRTTAYRSGLDLFASCRIKPGSAVADLQRPR